MRVALFIAYLTAGVLAMVEPTSLQIGIKKKISPEKCLRKSVNGDQLSMHYTGTLFSTGVKFDSSLDRGDPFEFTLGKKQNILLENDKIIQHSGSGEVIQGWDQGLLNMCVGERRKLTIPSHLGYGDRGSGSGKIPPKSTLVFEVELLGIKNPQVEL